MESSTVKGQRPYIGWQLMRTEGSLAV